MSLLFTFPAQKELAASLCATGKYALGEWEWRQFPDGESYVRIASDVQAKQVSLLCSLDQPDAKIMALVFLAKTLKELGAEKVTLIAPYLGYMRQDKRFKDGEAITSNIFAEFLSRYIDALITVDPHLHRHASLEEIYTCTCKVLTAAPLMADWIASNVNNALIIGPDMESEQWVKDVAARANAPYVILEKTRHGDRDVEIILPDVTPYAGRTPVLVDDIISTAATMIKAIGLLKAEGFTNAICVATHGVFAAGAYENLVAAGTAEVITANTIPHKSNGIDVAELITK